MSRAPGWEITDHVCRVCLGRVLARRGVYRCADCGAEGHGEPASVCACGATLKPGKNAGMRCVKNEQRSPEAPQEIAVKYVGRVA